MCLGVVEFTGSLKQSSVGIMNEVEAVRMDSNRCVEEEDNQHFEKVYINSSYYYLCRAKDDRPIVLYFVVEITTTDFTALMLMIMYILSFIHPP